MDEEHFVWTTEHTETTHSSVQPHRTAFIGGTNIHTKRAKLVAYSMNNTRQTHTCPVYQTMVVGQHGSKRSNVPGTKVVRAYRIPQRQYMLRQSKQSLQSHCCRREGEEEEVLAHKQNNWGHLGTTASTSYCYDVERGG